MYKKFFEQLAIFITASFSLVAALAWNSAITTLLNRYIKQPGNNIVSLFAYAIIITVIAVFVIVYLNKIVKKLDQKDK